ncbi:MAG: S-layer protein, partial [Thermoproteus sp.]|nr:S-layer protein [Thermoproteus sp.]
YGALTATFKICYFNDVCLTKNTTFYLPAPTLAINIAQNPPWAYPGSIVQLTISLSADQAVGPMDVKVNSPGLEILEGRSFHLPGLAPGAPVVLTAVIEVPRNASPGSYPITITAGGRNETYMLAVHFGALGVNAFFNPPVAYPGSIVTLTIAVSSIAELRDVRITVHSPFEILEGRSFHLPILPSGSPLTLTSIIKVPDGAKPGEYPVVVSIDGRNYTAYIHVESPTIIIQNIVLKPPVIIAGSPAPYVEAIVFLANTGVVPARDVVLSLSGLPTVGNSSVDIGVLPPGQPVQVPFLINASALSAGTYNIVARATWLGGEARAASPLTVLPKADLEVSYRVSNAQPGSTAVLALTIINKGPVAAKMVTLQWTPNQVFQLHTPSSSTPTATLLESGLRVLGDMAPGQNLSTTYLLDVSDKIPPGVYFATIVIEWNETGSPIPAVETVQIPISVSSSINWLEVGPLAAAAAVIAAGIALFISRRGRGAAAGGR